MEAKMEKRFDDYVFYTADESEFLTEISEMEKNSVWMPGIPRTALTVLPLDAPMFIQEAVDKYNIDPDLARDTVDDASAGTHLSLIHI